MKKIFLISLLVGAAKISSAQPYQSIFGKDSTTWIIEWSNLDFSAEANFDILEDSVYYQSNVYKMIGRSGAGSALIREDTLTGKIWSVDLIGNLSQPDQMNLN